MSSMHRQMWLGLENDELLRAVWPGLSESDREEMVRLWARLIGQAARSQRQDIEEENRDDRNRI